MKIVLSIHLHLHKEHLTWINIKKGTLKTNFVFFFKVIHSRCSPTPRLFWVWCGILEEQQAFSCLFWHNSVWLLPDFQSCPLAFRGNCQQWLVAILLHQSGEGQGCPSSTSSSWVWWPSLTSWWSHMSQKFTSGTWSLWLSDNSRGEKCFE